MSKIYEFTLPYGNKCGHRTDGSTLNTSKPLISEGQGAQPKLLIQANELIDQMFEMPNKWLKNLFHSAANSSGKSRQKRSERREGIIKLLKTIMKFLDIASLRIAVPGMDNQLHNLTLKVLARHAGMNLKRTERAWCDLKEAGIIKMQAIAETDDKGSVRAKASIKWISPDFFEAIGLGKWFKDTRVKFKNYVKISRQKAAQRQKMKKTTKADHAAQKMQLKGMMAKLFKRASQNNAQTPEQREAQIEQHLELKRQAHARALALHKETNRPISECLEWAYESFNR